MKQRTCVTAVLLTLFMGSGVELGLGTLAHAATLTETFEVTLTGKQWCEGNPALSEPFKVTVDPKHPAQSTTLTLTQDPLNSGDLTEIHATLNTQGANPALDAIPLKGRALPSNKTGRLEQVVLSGTDPNEPTHYLTLQGQATVNPAGHLLKVSGTYVFQMLSTYTTEKQTGTQSGLVDCFNSGTVATKGKALITGTLVDRPVDGVRYITSTNPVGGVTSSGGHFFCHQGETVTFLLGTFQLGQSQPCSADPVTVASVLGATSLTDPRVVNLAQLLMTLDSQASPDVLTIPTPLPAGVNPAAIPSLTDPNFDTTVLAALPNGTVLVTGEAALAQLQLALKQLTVTGGKNVTVTSTPTGINCANGAGTCSMIVPTGTLVTLTATGPGFTGWFGGGCSGAGSCVLTLTADTVVTTTMRLTVPRTIHTATMLKNGQILIAGGVSAAPTSPPAPALDTAELYDPTTKTVTPLINKMSSPRTNHTATLLPNGQVLLAGGQVDNSNGNGNDSAELYDPSTQTFTAIAHPLAVPRGGHAEALLPNGQVLLAGGFNGGFGDLPFAHNSAELYDPTTQLFTPIADTLRTSRADHPTATLLPNGQVLLTGGKSSKTVFNNSAELYNPITKTFTAISATMTSVRAHHTATRLPRGFVLLTGGLTSFSPTITGLDSVELYNPATQTFTAAPTPLAFRRAGHTATLLPNGSVLLIGGATLDANNSIVMLSNIDVYQP